MQTQHISDLFPNVISITKIRKDIDSLLKLLEEHKEVKVLSGQKVLFNVTRPDTEKEKQERIKRAVEGIRAIAKSHKRKEGEKSLSDIVIEERDRMLQESYYEKHNR